MTSADVDKLYDAYVPSVSIETMACSREMAHTLAWLAELPRVKSILNLGSGLSSAIFRSTGKPTICYDDNAEWLWETEVFLKKRGLPADNLRLFRPGDGLEHADLVFHDLGDLDVRERFLGLAARRAEGGIVVLDDCQFTEYGIAVKELRDSNPYYLEIPIRGRTLDRHGRFAVGLIHHDWMRDGK